MIPVLAVFLAGCSSLALRGCAEPWQPPPKPASPTLSAYPAPTACADHDPHRRAYFGDLHVHTGYSFDARSYDVLATPDDAYRFARGEEIALWPYAPEGMPGRSKRLERPLDFAAVTDHAEWMGETTVCTDDSFAGYTSEGCRRYRGDLPPQTSLRRSNTPTSPSMRVVGKPGSGAFGGRSPRYRRQP